MLFLLSAIALLILGFLVLGYIGVPLWTWTIYAATVLWVAQAPSWLWIGFGIAAIILNIPKLRQILLTSPIYGVHTSPARLGLRIQSRLKR